MVVTIIKIVFAVVFCLLLGCVIIYLLYRWKPDSLKKNGCAITCAIE